MSTASKNTAFVLVPGSFSPSTFYDRVVPLLQKQGYEAYPTPLLSAGERDEGPATFQEDTDFIHAAILKLADQGKDVVLGMNSYGGFPGTEASKGLSKSERQKEGKKGGLTGLVYLASFIPPVGVSLRSSMGDNLPDSIKKAVRSLSPLPPNFLNPARLTYVQGDYMKMNYEEDWKNIYNDLPEAEARHFMNQMPNHSTISLSGELTYPGYKFIPTTYLVTENDKIISPEAQKEMIAFAEGEGVKVNVITTQSGHVPMLSIPEKVAETLIGAANAV